MNNKIILFYKALEAPGGAERLLFHEYNEFKKLGFDVNIVTYRFNSDAFFSREIKQDDLVVLGGRGVQPLIRLRSYLKKNRGAIILGSSGHLDMYLATLFLECPYSLHIHHPSYMSFNEYDKYSIFQIKHFDSMLKSNYGAKRFKNIRDSLNLVDQFKINVRAAISIRAIKKAQNVFVLSELAKKEKKVLFNVDAHVVCGALEDEILEDSLTNTMDVYGNYKNKFLTIARLDKNKRIDVLLQAFSKFLTHEPDSVLVIGGNGDEKQSLIDLSEHLKIEKSVKFLGFVPDEELYALYAGADVFVSIDWADYRITTFEALAMGTKVILSNETDFGTELTASGYLALVQPTLDETHRAMSESINTEPSMTQDELREYLQELTWSGFCKRLLKYLVV